MKEDDLQVVVEDVRGFVVEVNPKFLTTLKYKFSKAEYQEVAALPFKFCARLRPEWSTKKKERGQKKADIDVRVSFSFNEACF